MSSKGLGVFISYARGDTDAANRLYNDLKVSGLDPWLDTQSLLGGQKWKIVIKERIENSRYFIILLSSNSVQKIGFVQTELKEAFETFKKFPSSETYIIPVRLDDSEISDEELKEFHMIDLFPDWSQGIQKLLKSMNINDSVSDITTQEDSIYHYDEWTELLRYIYEKKCSPFIGPEVRVRWIPANRDIAVQWAEDLGYPFEDRFELPQVAQYMAITKHDDMLPKNYLSRILKGISPPDFSLPEYQNTVYSVLADLNLPIYITTNYDHLMEEALKCRGKEPKSEFFIWNEALSKYAKGAGLAADSEDNNYVPSAASPLVFHLHGDMHHPTSMVLTEQDFLDFIHDVSDSNKSSLILPSVLRKSFAISSQLFVGFGLGDTNSRMLFSSIASLLGAVDPPFSLAVTSPPSTNIHGENVVSARNYLNEYAKRWFKLNIYWSDPYLFSIKLRNGFNEFRQGISSNK